MTSKTSLTIIGNGTMGQAIAGLAGKSATAVQTLGRADGAESVTGDIVILAVPYQEVENILDARREELAGKVVVDITNPVDPTTFDGFVVPADSSAAAEIAAALPDSKVVKGFNTTFGSTLASGVVGPLPTTVLIAGDDDSAKGLVAEFITGAGLKVADVGGLKRAREMEALAFLQIGLAVSEQVSWTGGLGVVA
jgi:NADPH-dependent F420 reductase